MEDKLVWFQLKNMWRWVAGSIKIKNFAFSFLVCSKPMLLWLAYIYTPFYLYPVYLTLCSHVRVYSWNGWHQYQIALWAGLEIRNSVPGAIFKEFVEKWPLCIASSINNWIHQGHLRIYGGFLAQWSLLIARRACGPGGNWSSTLIVGIKTPGSWWWMLRIIKP